MKVFKDCFFNIQNTCICGVCIFKFPMAAETHKEARGRNYSHFTNKNMDKKQGSND